MGINYGYNEVKLNNNLVFNNETLETKVIRMIEYIRFNMYAYKPNYEITLFIEGFHRISITLNGIILVKRNSCGYVIELDSTMLTDILSVNNRAYEKIETMYNQLRTGIKLFEDKTPQNNKIVSIPQTRLSQKIASFI